MTSKKEKLQNDFAFLKGMESVQVEIINDEPWFLAKDVCDVLKLLNTSGALKALDDDEKTLLTVIKSGQERKVNFINESGLYQLIFRSNKPKARQLRKKLTKMVSANLPVTTAVNVLKEGGLL